MIFGAVMLVLLIEKARGRLVSLSAWNILLSYTFLFILLKIFNFQEILNI